MKIYYQILIQYSKQFLNIFINILRICNLFFLFFFRSNSSKSNKNKSKKLLNILIKPVQVNKLAKPAENVNDTELNEFDSENDDDDEDEDENEREITSNCFLYLLFSKKYSLIYCVYRRINYHC